MRRMALLPLLAALVLMAISVPALGENRLKFAADLTGASEVPPVQTATTGNVEVEFNADATAADFELEVFDGLAVTQAHLHCGAAGQNGPVVVFLFGFIPGGFDLDGQIAKFTL